MLLDPELGAAQCIASGAMPGDRGLVVALERTGYGGEAHARESRLLEGWSAAKARRMGASAAKLLVYYHPAASTAARIERLVRRRRRADCAREDLLLLLEPLVYNPEPGRRGARAGRAAARDRGGRAAAQAGVGRRRPQGGVPGRPTDEGEWLAACQELTAACPIPWILLSAKVDFDTFLRQTEVACRAGASGVAVGRAVWSEATRLAGAERTAFLRGEARRRMAAATALCAETGAAVVGGLPAAEPRCLVVLGLLSRARRRESGAMSTRTPPRSSA